MVDVAAWSAVLGSTLWTPTGEQPTDQVLANKKKVALYISGSYCPWCRQLAPLMEDTIRKLKAADPDDTEVVYISADIDESAFAQFLDGKPYSAMTYNRSAGNGEAPMGYVPKKVREATGKPMGALQEKFNLSNVPQVVVLDGSTQEVTHQSFITELGSKPTDGMAWSDAAPKSWMTAAT